MLGRMTVSTENCGPNDFNWTGVETVFAPGWPAKATADVRVTFRAVSAPGVVVPLTLGLHYSVDLEVGSRLVTVLPLTMPLSNGIVTIARRTPALQGVRFANLNKYSPDVHMELHDAAAMRDAELRSGVDRALDKLEFVEEMAATAEAAVAVVTEARDEAIGAAAALADQVHTYDTLTQLSGAVVPPGVNAVRLVGAQTIGDMPAQVLKRIAAPGIIKPWHKPSNGAWFELMSVVGRWEFFGGKTSGSALDVAANNQAFSDAGEFLQSRTFSGQRGEVTIPAGIIRFDQTANNLAHQYCSIKTEGTVRMRYEGAGTGFLFDGGAAGPGKYGFACGHFIFEGLAAQNASAVIARAMHESSFSVNGRGGSTAHAVLEMQWCVGGSAYICVSGNDPASVPPSGGFYGGARPGYGLIATTRGNPLEQTSYMDFRCEISGANIGILMDAALGNKIRGYAQACPTYGLQFAAAAHSNKADGMDFEVNTIADVIIQGSWNEMIGCDSYTEIDFLNGAKENAIIGGSYQTIAVGAGATNNRIETRFNRFGGGGTLFDGGAGTRTTGSYDVGNSRWYLRPKVAVAVGASPFFWENKTGDVMTVLLSGAPSSGIGILRNGVADVSNAISGLIDLSPSDQLYLAYSGAAPSMYVMGR